MTAFINIVYCSTTLYSLLLQRAAKSRLKLLHPQGEVTAPRRHNGPRHFVIGAVHACGYVCSAVDREKCWRLFIGPRKLSDAIKTIDHSVESRRRLVSSARRRKRERGLERETENENDRAREKERARDGKEGETRFRRGVFMNESGVFRNIERGSRMRVTRSPFSVPPRPTLSRFTLIESAEKNERTHR